MGRVVDRSMHELNVVVEHAGVARGSGWQHIGAYVNLGSYYVVGIPVALLLGFVLHLQGEGLWTGLVAGTTVQALSLSLITALTNWEKLVFYSILIYSLYIQSCIMIEFQFTLFVLCTGKGSNTQNFYPLLRLID